MKANSLECLVMATWLESLFIVISVEVFVGYVRGTIGDGSIIRPFSEGYLLVVRVVMATSVER